MSYKSQDITVDLTNSMRLWQESTTYPTGSSADDSINLTAGDYLDVGQALNSGYYWRLRWFINFNLSYYMSMDAVLHYKIYSINDAGHTFYLQVRGSSAAVPPALADWPDYGSTVLDSKLSSDLSAGSWYTVNVPASMLANVVKFAITTDREIAGTEPTDLEKAFIYAKINSMYLTVQVPIAPVAPTNIGIIPLSDGKHTQATAKYHKAGTNGNTQCTQYQIQISNTSDFSNILHDTGKIAPDTPLNDGETISKFLEWLPDSEGTYYIRVAAWDDDNKDMPAEWGINDFTVGYPAINKLNYTHNKEHYAFTTEIQDSYTKPPIVSLTVDNNAKLMELTGRSGSGPYTYMYKTDFALEKGQHKYYVEVGNVWTTLDGDVRTLFANYKLNYKNVLVFRGNMVLNTWNMILTEALLPNFATLEFDTDTYVNANFITVKLWAGDFRTYSFRIRSIQKRGNKWHISCDSTAKEDFNQIVSFSSEAINSLDLLKSILPDYYFIGTLDETIVMQQFVNTAIKDIVSSILILNNKRAVERNKKIIIFDDTRTPIPVQAYDIDVTGFAEDRHSIVNDVLEFYSIKQYPVPRNSFTVIDAANWSGTVSDVQETDIGLTSDSGEFSFLKANGTIARSVDFSKLDFDHLHLNWNPDTATILEIRLEKDTSNYYKYTRNFSGEKGAGFILTGNAENDVVSRSIIVSQTKISRVEGWTSDNCKARVTLRLSGAEVAQSPWLSGGKHFWTTFDNIDADEIFIEFTDLYLINNKWGVNCYRLPIEQYVKMWQVTGSKRTTVFRRGNSGETNVQTTYQSGDGEWETTTIATLSPVDLGAIHLLGEGETLHSNASAQVVGIETSGSPYSDGHTFKYFNVAGHISVQNGHYIVNFDQVRAKGIDGFKSAASYKAGVYVDKIQSTGEWIWQHESLPWSETYNLWDKMNIPLSAFTTVGSPGKQINTIRLIASGYNYYGTLYLSTNNPNVYSVEVVNEDSVNKWGKHFQRRTTDGWSSKEAARAFAAGLVNVFGNTLHSIEKRVPFEAEISVGDIYSYGGDLLFVYKTVYDFQTMQKTISIGTNPTDTLQFLKDVARRIGAIEQNIVSR